MIPLRDATPTKNFPVVNNAIIGINVVIFILQLSQGADWNKFAFTYGMVPARYSIPQISAYFSAPQQVFSFVSFMFLHGGFWHLLGNMWSLYIFGDNVEDRLGPLRYLAFYLICGVASGLSHLLLNLNSKLPVIGASGAIAGVMGAYFILHPRSKILTLIPIFLFPISPRYQPISFSDSGSYSNSLMLQSVKARPGGVAWWAHIGGFIFGIVFLKFLLALPGAESRTKIRQGHRTEKNTAPASYPPGRTRAGSHLYGVITISPHEAAAGTHKLVNIPWGFHKRLFKVSVPPGVKEGNKLRLKGLGKQAGSDYRSERGNLYLKVRIQ